MSNYKNTICLAGRPVYKEADAIADITPGELIEFADGVVDDQALRGVQPHSTANDGGQKMFATIGLVEPDIDRVYTAGERVMYLTCATGDEVNAFLAPSQDVKKGDALGSAGDGSLQTTTGTVIGYASEALATTVERMRIILEVA